MQGVAAVRSYSSVKLPPPPSSSSSSFSSSVTHGREPCIHTRPLRQTTPAIFSPGHHQSGNILRPQNTPVAALLLPQLRSQHVSRATATSSSCPRVAAHSTARLMADASSHDGSVPATPAMDPLGGGGVGALTPAPPARPFSTSLAHSYNFRIVKEELSYSRYINVFNRVVELPEPPPPPPGRSAGQQPLQAGETAAGGRGRTVEYDVVGARTVGCQFVAVVPFHSATKSVTLIREYAQGPNDLVYTVPCGGVGQKHASLEDAAHQELSEEAHLCGGKWVKLLPDGHPGLLEVKWCKNRFTPFLVIDPETDGNPRPKDAEEFIEVVEVGVAELRHVMYNGDMMLPSVVTCNLALDYLQRHGLLGDSCVP